MKYIRVSGPRRPCGLCKMDTIRCVVIVEEVQSIPLANLPLCNNCLRELRQLSPSHLDRGEL
jgi:hypothetical protein